MSGSSSKSLPSEGIPRQIIPRDDSRTLGVIAWSSFFFALLQSICTFFLALSGVRLVIVIGSVVLSAGAATALEKFHANWIRLPMVGLALRLFTEPRRSYTNSHSTQPSSFTLAPTAAEFKRGADGTGAVVLVVRNTYSRRNRRILALEPVPEPVGVAGDDLKRGHLPGKLKVAFRKEQY